MEMSHEEIKEFYQANKNKEQIIKEIEKYKQDAMFDIRRDKLQNHAVYHMLEEVDSVNEG